MPAAFAALFLIALLASTFAGALPLAVGALYALASAGAAVLYGLDKSAARRGLPRTRERTLHAVALAGGWPGALIAQAVFRHKTRKQAFQVLFWLTSLGNCAALAALLVTGVI